MIVAAACIRRLRKGMVINMNENEYGNNGQYGSLKEHIPEGLMEHLPEGVKDRIEDAIYEADQKLSNPYERVEPDIPKIQMNTKIAISATVIGFGGVLVFAKINPIIAVLCFGIMALIFGIGIVADKNFSFRKNAMSILVLLIGVYMVLIAGYLLVSKYNPSLPELEGKFLNTVAGIGLIILGAFVLILYELELHYLKNACSERVQAVCVYIKEKKEYQEKRRRTVYAPVFEFQFFGNTYCVAENYGNRFVPTVGDRYELFVNPNNLKEFYRKGTDSRVRIWIFSIVFILFGIWVFFFN